jgi:hypothetical protein
MTANLSSSIPSPLRLRLLETQAPSPVGTTLLSYRSGLSASPACPATSSLEFATTRRPRPHVTCATPPRSRTPSRKGRMLGDDPAFGQVPGRPGRSRSAAGSTPTFPYSGGSPMQRPQCAASTPRPCGAGSVPGSPQPGDGKPAVIYARDKRRRRATARPVQAGPEAGQSAMKHPAMHQFAFRTVEAANCNEPPRILPWPIAGS